MDLCVYVLSVLLISMFCLAAMYLLWYILYKLDALSILATCLVMFLLIFLLNTCSQSLIGVLLHFHSLSWILSPTLVNVYFECFQLFNGYLSDARRVQLLSTRKVKSARRVQNSVQTVTITFAYPWERLVSNSSPNSSYMLNDRLNLPLRQPI